MTVIANNFKSKYLKYKTKYLKLKEQIGGYTCEQWLNHELSLSGTNPNINTIFREFTSSINFDGGARNPAVNCGLYYIIKNWNYFSFTSVRFKLIIDGMNIIRNKYILLAFLGETFNFIKPDIIENEIYQIIRNPKDYVVSINLIKSLIPLIIKLFGVNNTDIYITYQSLNNEIEILDGYNIYDLEKELFGFALNEKNTNTVHLLGIPCMSNDGLATNTRTNKIYRNTDPSYCFQSSGNYHNDADDIVCAFLYYYFTKVNILSYVSLWSYDNYSWYRPALRNNFLELTIQYTNQNYSNYNSNLISGSIYPLGAIVLVNLDTGIEYAYKNRNFLMGITDYIHYLSNNLTFTINLPSDIISILTT